MANLLLINSNADVGSTGKICVHIANAYIERGWNVKIAYGRDISENATSNPMFYHITAPLNLQWHGICTRLFDRHGFASKIATKKFLKWANEYDPDVLWLHNIHGYYINVEMLFEWIKSRPNMKVKWTLHDEWSFTGHCPCFNEIRCEQWVTGCKKCPQKKDYPSSLFVDNCKGNYERKKKAFTGVKELSIITPSEWLANLVARSFLKEYHTKVVNNGIDISIFSPSINEFKKINRCENKFVILGVAWGWGRKKGLDVFIELSKKMDDRFQIVLVGTNEAIDAQLPENIISIHRTHDQKELAQIYSAADVFVNPTREEVFGLVNVESLACGTPVITFDTGGSPECIDETCGYVVSVDDIDAMEKAIIRICENKPFSQNACIERARLFDLNTIREYYLSMIEEDGEF